MLLHRLKSCKTQRMLRVFVTLLLVGTLSAVAVQAQPAPPLAAEDARAREEALELFKQGRTAYKAGDYAAALDLFRRAQARFEREPLIILALAKTLERKGTPADGQEPGQAELRDGRKYYELFLKVAPITPAATKDREEAVAAVKRIDAMLAQMKGILKFKGLPSGAQLELDGKPADTDAQGDVRVPAGTYKIRVTMDKRLPFDRPTVTVGPGETKVIEVVLVAPVDPSTLPRDHTWTWVAGGTSAASILVGGVFGVLMLQELDGYKARFNDNGQPTEEARKDHPVVVDGKSIPCRVGFKTASGAWECEGAVAEGKQREDKWKSRRDWMFISLGTGAALGFATAALYYSAPIKDSGKASEPPKTTWQLRPMWLDDGMGAVLSVGL